MIHCVVVLMLKCPRQCIGIGNDYTRRKEMKAGAYKLLTSVVNAA